MGPKGSHVLGGPWKSHRLEVSVKNPGDDEKTIEMNHRAAWFWNAIQSPRNDLSKTEWGMHTADIFWQLPYRLKKRTRQKRECQMLWNKASQNRLNKIYIYITLGVFVSRFGWGLDRTVWPSFGFCPGRFQLHGRWNLALEDFFLPISCPNRMASRQFTTTSAEVTANGGLVWDSYL